MPCVTKLLGAIMDPFDTYTFKRLRKYFPPLDIYYGGGLETRIVL